MLALPLRSRYASLVLAAGVLLLGCASANAAITEIGKPGLAEGEFTVPGGVATDGEGNVYVLDSAAGTLQKFTNTGSLLKDVGAVNGQALSEPEGVAVDSSGNVFVADSGNKRLLELNSSLEYVKELASGSYMSIAAGTCAGTPCIVTLQLSGSNHLLTELNESGTILHEYLAPAGSAHWQLAEPNKNGAIHDQVAIGAEGVVYVTDADGKRVMELNTNLEVQPAELSGLTGYAQAIAAGTVEGKPQVYVGDDNYQGTASVKRFSPSGTLLGELPVGGAHGGLATDASGDVFDSYGSSGGSVLRIDTTPDPVLSVNPSTALSSQTATFDASASTVSLWSVADYSWDPDSGSFSIDTGTAPTISDRFNAPGSYPIAVKVTGTNGRAAETTLQYAVGSSSAAFTGPTSALTGQAVTFNAAPSALPLSSVSDYAWDFDGSSSFALDVGATPTISHTFTAPGTYTVQLRVTRAGGRVDTVSASILVTLAPPPGATGVSIDEGAYATNNPKVTLDAVWPAGANSLLISNDGGFGTAGSTATLPLAAAVPWTLEQTGPERLPKTVYVRFLGAGIDTQNFTDDIILDQRPPALESAALLGGSSAQAASGHPPHAHLRRYHIRVRAKDRIVGVCAIEVSSRRSDGVVEEIARCHDKGLLKVAKVFAVDAPAKPAYLRVRNSAGSWSRWLRLAG